MGPDPNAHEFLLSSTCRIQRANPDPRPQSNFVDSTSKRQSYEGGCEAPEPSDPRAGQAKDLHCLIE